MGRTEKADIGCLLCPQKQTFVALVQTQPPQGRKHQTKNHHAGHIFVTCIFVTCKFVTCRRTPLMSFLRAF